MEKGLKIYFHEPSDSLGIAGEAWDYIVLVKFVPFIKKTYTQGKLIVCYEDPVEYVEHPIAQPKTEDWVLIGDL